MNVRQALQQRQAEGRPIRVGATGADWMGSGFVAQMAHVPGMVVAVLAHDDIAAARDAFLRTGVAAGDIVEASAAGPATDAIRAGKRVVTGDVGLAAQLATVDIVADVTFSPATGAQTAEACIRHGKDIVLVAHAFKVMEKNPSGEDWLKWKPRLQDSTKCNIQERVMEWADHVVFIKPDVAVNSKTHKGKGGMSLMIHTQPAAGYEAGSRTLNEDMPYPEGSADLWTQLKGHHNGMA